MKPAAIPFNRPTIVSRELHYMSRAILAGHASGDGPFSAQCQELLQSLTGARHVLLTPSCTDALEMCALLLDLQPGDEVIMPSFSFVSTANAFVLHGAKPVFVDVRPDTFNLDESLVPAAISPRTRAIVAVHYGGIACDLDALLSIARAHSLVLIEDNAHGLLGTYRGRPLGSFGDMATLSFHETKNFTCGEGGALLLNHNRLLERAEILRDKGTNRKRFFRGQVDKYSWVDLGSSFALADLLAAFLLAQLESRDLVQARRQTIWDSYRSHLQPWAEHQGIILPTIPNNCDPAWHLFYLVLPSLQARSRFIAHLRTRDILAVFHYQPLHDSEMAHTLGLPNQPDLPQTRRAADCLVRLPFFTDMTEDELDRVIEACLSFTL